MSFPRSISLQVREVTSVSVTFALRISLDDLSDLSYTLVDDESDPDETGPAISDALRRGLAVKVNGNNWKRVVVQVDEDEEEAIVIVYGLQSRRKYEVSLTLVVSDESLAENVTTLSPGMSSYHPISFNINQFRAVIVHVYQSYSFSWSRSCHISFYPNPTHNTYPNESSSNSNCRREGQPAPKTTFSY